MNNETKKECNVCFEEIEDTDAAVLSCDHSFCDTCLKTWEKGTCPTCRNRFRPDREESILQEYIDIRIEWLDQSLAKTIYGSFNLARSTLECKLKMYSGDTDTIEKEEIFRCVLEKMKNKLTLLFCRTVNGRSIIKEMKTIETVQKKTHKTFMEFLNGMYLIFIDGEKELDRELMEYFSGNEELKSKKRESFKQKPSNESQISVFFI